MKMRTQHQKSIFNFIHYNSHGLVNSTCHPTLKMRLLHCEKEAKPNEQNNTKPLRINVKMECKCDYRMQ